MHTHGLTTSKLVVLLRARTRENRSRTDHLYFHAGIAKYVTQPVLCHTRKVFSYILLSTLVPISTAGSKEWYKP